MDLLAKRKWFQWFYCTSRAWLAMKRQEHANLASRKAVELGPNGITNTTHHTPQIHTTQPVIQTYWVATQEQTWICLANRDYCQLAIARALSFYFLLAQPPGDIIILLTLSSTLMKPKLAKYKTPTPNDDLSRVELKRAEPSRFGQANEANFPPFTLLLL